MQEFVLFVSLFETNTDTHSPTIESSCLVSIFPRESQWVGLTWIFDGMYGHLLESVCPGKVRRERNAISNCENT
jgi:hypothetical protein